MEEYVLDKHTFFNPVNFKGMGVNVCGAFSSPPSSETNLMLGMTGAP